MRRKRRNSVSSIKSYEKLELLPQSAGSHSRSLTKLSSRTRSVSPAPFTLSVNGKLPQKKFNNIYAKVVNQLETLKSLSETKINESENPADLRRQLQRGEEFSIRFSRNNTYETRRIINDIKKLIVQFPVETLPSSECKLLCKKIILAYQAVSQALQTYINYVKNPSNSEVPDKINEIIVLIADLFVCCDSLSLVPSDTNVKNDGVRICNELMSIFSKKLSLPAEVKLKETEVKKKNKSHPEEPSKNNTLSMYMAKLKMSKTDIQKKPRAPGLFGKPRRLKKKEEKAARITHEIYTQKMHSQKPLGSKIVKFEPAAENNNEETAKPCARKPKFTPREVKSRDYDVETMIQIIGDDDNVSARQGQPSGESDENSARSNKTQIRDLLLEAIDDLENPDKKEQKASLGKLLNSIQSHSRNPNVKVYNFKSKDYDQEPEREEVDEEKEKPEVDLVTLHEKQKALDEILSRERRLKIPFKVIDGKNAGEAEGEVVPRGKIKLKIPENMRDSLNAQKKAFDDFTKSNIMYKKTLAKKPWNLIAKVADHVLLDLLKELALDFQNDAMLRRLYLNELLEVVN